MRIDEYKTLVREQVSWPGSIGDACAETCWLDHMLVFLQFANYQSERPELDVEVFRTDKGYVRHPTAPEKDDKGESWRESDFSSDQAHPLFRSFKYLLERTLREEMRTRIKDAGMRTGNGDLVSPDLYADLTLNNFLINLCFIGQWLLFKFYYRWSDSKNKFEPIEDSSCDYLQWIQTFPYVSVKLRRLIPAETLKAKIRAYYKDEPNSDWLVSYWFSFIDLFVL